MIYQIECNLKKLDKDKHCDFEKCEYWINKFCSLNQMLAINAKYINTNVFEPIFSKTGINITLNNNVEKSIKQLIVDIGMFKKYFDK